MDSGCARAGAVYSYLSCIGSNEIYLIHLQLSDEFKFPIASIHHAGETYLKRAWVRCMLPDRYSNLISIKPRAGKFTGDCAVCIKLPVRAFFNYYVCPVRRGDSSVDEEYCGKYYGG